VKTTGMVTDFKHLGWFKNFLDDTLDHKFIMDIKDPLIDFEASGLTDVKGQFNLNFCHKMPEGYYVPDLTYISKMLEDENTLTDAQKSAIFEKYEGMVFVDFVPTSENLSGWLLSVVQEKMKDLPGVRVKALEYWETPKSHCRVEA
jgi:6-pyruvoyltetrahydropterin/6-carboxytetrahydropterin synthase